MSLINFLNPKLKPSIECEAICEDGFAAANLIADNEEQQARGFMAFSVTKPPVELVFDFPKAVDLKVIKLWNSSGALRSTAFEVHSKYEGIWERVAYVRDLDKGVDFVTFCYQSDYNSRSNTVDGAQQQSEKAFFFKTAHKILSNTNSIKIIIRATHKSPPLLRKVQIWGLPSRSLEKGDRELVKTIWSEVINNPYDQRSQQQQQQQSGQRSPPRVPELNEHSTLNIPEDFLDAITWELMIFPTVLPSGKVVDQSTIDKHSEEEAKWGRTPSDPFTGLEFTSHRKAILNLALKARIEKFLMENSEHFKTVPRSLGSSRVRRSKNRHASQFASLCQGHSNVVGTYSILTAAGFKTATKSSATATYSSSTLAAMPPPSKRAKLSIDASTTTTTTTTTYRSDVKTLLTSTATQTSATATASFSTPSASSTTAPAATSIDEAIQQALQKITRFTCPPTAAAIKHANCISCKSEDFTYEIQTCKHLVCRSCLVQLTQLQMCSCKTSFCSADVERYHKL